MTDVLDAPVLGRVLMKLGEAALYPSEVIGIAQLFLC